MPRDQQWLDSVLRIVQGYPKDQKFTADQVRIDAQKQKVGSPTRSGQWGAAIQAAARAKLIRKTGHYEASQIKFFHGRIQAEWERV